MNIVFGGSFNPPTKAHFEIAKIVLDQYPVEHFIYLPVPDSYNKSSLISKENRVEMIQILVNSFHDDRVIYSTQELEEVFKGTYYSLKKLQSQYSNIWFLMGADNLDYLDKWIEAEKLVQEFHFLVVTRDNFNVERTIHEKFSSFVDHFKVIHLQLDISSTKIRNSTNLYSKDTLPEIYEYIQKNHLYEVK